MKDILLFEVNKQEEATISSYLSNAGHSLTSTDNLGDIPRFLTKKSPDIFIMDVDFTVTTDPCLELCATLKSDERFSHIPILIFVHKGDVEKTVKFIKTKMVEFVMKPFESYLFLERVDSILEEMNLKKHGKIVLDLNYLNYLIKFLREMNREDFFSTIPIIFNSLIIDKVRKTLGEPVIEVLLRGLCDTISQDHRFMKDIKLLNNQINIDNVDVVSKNVDTEELTLAFHDYIYGFLQVTHGLAPNIIMKRSKIAVQRFSG